MAIGSIDLHAEQLSTDLDYKFVLLDPYFLNLILESPISRKPVVPKTHKPQIPRNAPSLKFSLNGRLPEEVLAWLPTV